MSNLLTKDQASQILMETAAGFYTQNWMLGTSGNLSIRVARQGIFLITASSVDKGQLTPDDFVLMGENNTLLSQTPHKPSAETCLHSALYKAFPEIQAVYHIHTPTATALSMTLKPGEVGIEFSGLEMIKGLGFETHDITITVPVIENTQDIAALSEVLIDCINPDIPGFLLKGHGLYAWGKTPFEAKRHVEIFEFLFQVKLQQTMLQAAAHKSLPSPLVS